MDTMECIDNNKRKYSNDSELGDINTCKKFKDVDTICFDSSVASSAINSPANSGKNSPVNLGENSSVNFTENSPENSGENFSVNFTENSPENSGENFSVNFTENSPVNLGENSSVNFTENSPENSGENFSVNFTENSPENSGDNSSVNSTDNDDENDDDNVEDVDADVAPMSQLQFGAYLLNNDYRMSLPTFYTPAMVISTYLGDNEDHPGACCIPKPIFLISIDDITLY
jgi:hypothetical protein